jgi:SanA protein
MRRALAIAAGFLTIALIVPNLIVWAGGRGPVTTDTREVPHAQAALVLGAQVMPNGAPSSMLSDRITAAAELYESGRVDKLLLSGDHSRWEYDEVGTMRRILLKRGIPAEDIFTDHAGFDTWDSAQRARRVFDVDTVVVVTQRFHMARAIFDARRAGLRATGYAADRRDYGRVMPRLQVREAAARVKTVGDAITGADPHFLGPRIPITGDGRASWGPISSERT